MPVAKFPCIGCCFIDTTAEGQDYCIPYNVLVGSNVDHEVVAHYIAEKHDLLSDSAWQRITVAMMTIANGNVGPGTRFGDYR